MAQRNVHVGKKHTTRYPVKVLLFLVAAIGLFLFVFKPFSSISPAVIKSDQTAKETSANLITGDGWTIKSLKKGDGVTFPKQGQTVTIHYTGTLEDGKVFDSSRERNQPFQTQIGVGRVIRGWDEGVPKLSVGERAILTIQPEAGYGSRPMGPIPANSVLIFDVELISVA